MSINNFVFTRTKGHISYNIFNVVFETPRARVFTIKLFAAVNVAV
jgi:hypothetical protein